MITIRQKLRPFSHTIGTKCLVPGTDVIVEAFPKLLRVGNEEVPINIESGFTLQQDLERNCVWVFGDNTRKKIVGPSFDHIEKLSLGSHKSQDWDMVRRRMDIHEILPVLYNLGQKAKPGNCINFSNYEEFYRQNFEHIVVPKLPVLREVYEKIRSHFILENENGVIFLPDNPFPHGRLLNLKTKFGTFDLEWTKHKLKRVIVHPTIDGELVFPYSFRRKTSLHEKGMFMKHRLPIEAGKRLYLDRFFE